MGLLSLKSALMIILLCAFPPDVMNSILGGVREDPNPHPPTV